MNKNALIIGGSSGIGLAAVKKLAENQFNLFIIHRDRRSQIKAFETSISTLREKFECRIVTFNADATNHEKVSQIIDQFTEENLQFQLVLHAVSRGNLKPLVNNDGPSITAQDLALTIDSMGTNFHYWAKQLLEKSLVGQGSRLITLTSEGNDKFWPGYGAVALAKSTLETLTKYLAVEMAKFGITVNAIKAGVTDTPSLRLIPHSEKLIESTKKRNPFGRMTTTEDVANAIFLLSLPEASWINGSIIHIDGGEHLI